MTNHPNRSKKAPHRARNPSPEEVKAARAKTGLTQKTAAALVYKSEIAWKKWEGKPPEESVFKNTNRNMPPDTWELFIRKSIEAGYLPPEDCRTFLGINFKDLSTPEAMHNE